MENIQNNNDFKSIEEIEKSGISRKSFIYRRWCALCIDTLIIISVMIYNIFSTNNGELAFIFGIL